MEIKKMGILGLGGCGSSIVGKWSKTTTIPCAIINTTIADSFKGQGIKDSYLISEGKLGGMAKERKKIIEAVKNDADGFSTFIENFIEKNSIGSLITVAASGGGTGSGLVTEICELFSNSINLRVIIITPEFSEGIIPLLNTTEVISLLQTHNTAIRVVSNANFIYQDEQKNITNKNEIINNYIIRTENDVLSSTDSINPYGKSVDHADLTKILFRKGFSSTYYHILSKNDDTESLIAKTNRSFDTEINSDKIVGTYGFIYYGNNLNPESINKLKIFQNFGEPMDYYEAFILNKQITYYGTETLSPNYIYFIASGCNMPNSLSKYRDEYNRLKENRGKRSIINLQVDDIEDTVINHNIVKKVLSTKENNEDWKERMKKLKEGEKK